jgi:hypothetical protein
MKGIPMQYQRMMAAVLILLAVSLGVLALDGDEGTSLLKTDDGLLVVHNSEWSHFTMEIKAKSFRVARTEPNFFLEVDGCLIQVVTTKTSPFIQGAVGSKLTDREILERHRDWESEHINSLLGEKLKVRSEFVVLSSGKEALHWEQALPPGKSQAKENLYLTAVVGQEVVLINGVVINADEKAAIRSKLAEILSTLKPSTQPISIRALQDKIRQGN